MAGANKSVNRTLEAKVRMLAGIKDYAHLSVVFAALAVSQFVEDRTGWSIRKFVRTTRRYRTVHIRAPEVVRRLTGLDQNRHDPRQGLPAPPPRPRVAAAQHPLNGTLPSP